MSSANSSSNAERALDVLLLLGECGPEGMSLAEISSGVGVTKPAVHRTLVSLTRRGFAEPSGRYGHYRLGPAIPLLARRQERLEPQIQRLRPGMAEFARRTGYTVYLMVQSGVDAVCAEMVSRSPRSQFRLGVGGRVPMGVAAGSVALLSMLSEEKCEAILAANSERYLSHPTVRHVDRAVVAGQVADAKARGFAVNMGYYLPGEGGLGLPMPRQLPFEVDLAVSFNTPTEMMVDPWMEQVMGELRACLSGGA